jgi:hypothetical protein
MPSPVATDRYETYILGGISQTCYVLEYIEILLDITKNLTNRNCQVARFLPALKDGVSTRVPMKNLKERILPENSLLKCPYCKELFTENYFGSNSQAKCKCGHLWSIIERDGEDTDEIYLIRLRLRTEYPIPGSLINGDCNSQIYSFVTEDV